MAFVGLKYVVAATLKTEEKVAANTYDSGFVVGKAMKANIQINAANAFLYGDDAVAESDTGFTSGTVTIGTTKMTDDIQSKLLGHKQDTGDAGAAGEITGNIEDIAPYHGVGFYAPKLDDHKRKYRAIWFTKVIFADPNESLETKQGSTNFVTPELAGTIMQDAKGDWKKEQTFDTEAEAIAYLNAKAGITAT